MTSVWLYSESDGTNPDEWSVCATEKVAKTLMARDLRRHLEENSFSGDIPRSDNKLIEWYSKDWGNSEPFTDLHLHINKYQLKTK